MYTPVDVTPPELQPHALTNPEPWIIDTQTDPTQITDWPARQATAIVPFTLDTRGWPSTPTGRTGKTGRNLGKWGETQPPTPSSSRHQPTSASFSSAAATPANGPSRRQGRPRRNRPRRSRPRTGRGNRCGPVRDEPRILWRGYVNDPRNTDHAWITTTVALYRVTEMVPTVAGDDATDARWWPWTGDVNHWLRSSPTTVACMTRTGPCWAAPHKPHY